MLILSSHCPLMFSLNILDGWHPGVIFYDKNWAFWSSAFLLTLRCATFLGILAALVIALSIKFAGYYLARSNSFSSFNLRPLRSFVVQILIILKANGYGIAFEVALGWQEDGSKYWLECVFFLCKSISILPFSMPNSVSKNGIELFFSHPQLSSGDSFSGVV